MNPEMHAPALISRNMETDMSGDDNSTTNPTPGHHALAVDVVPHEPARELEFQCKKAERQPRIAALLTTPHVDQAETVSMAAGGIKNAIDDTLRGEREKVHDRCLMLGRREVHTALLASWQVASKTRITIHINNKKAGCSMCSFFTASLLQHCAPC